MRNDMRQLRLSVFDVVLLVNAMNVLSCKAEVQVRVLRGFRLMSDTMCRMIYNAN